MPNQIWSPEEGDEVSMKDGRTGIVGDIDSFVWDGGSDWQVTLNVPAGEIEKEEEDGVEAELPEDEVIEDQLIRYDEVERGWKEV
jgi:hypothetical protein